MLGVFIDCLSAFSQLVHRDSRSVLQRAEPFSLKLHMFTKIAALCGKQSLQLCQRFFATNASELHRWQRRCDRLTQLQRRIKFRPVESFTVGDRTFALPLAAVGPPSSAPTREELEYLVGFFDGDGCVSMHGDTGCITISVGQNLDSAEVLARFRDIFGGGVHHQNHGTGTRKALLQWRVYGTTMQNAARLLGSLSSMKHEQLQIAARGKVAKADRSKVAQKLSLLKQKEHKPATFQCSWPYFAGFFDAEGSISIHGCWVGMRLRVSQMNPFVLYELQEFLLWHNLTQWTVNSLAYCPVLECHHLETCQLTLQHLLDWGLNLKQKQAALALSLSPENHLEVRDAILHLNGLNNQYQRLDNKGIARAKEIQKVSRQLRNASSQEKHDLLQRKVQELREGHILQNLITKCQRLRSGIRQSLKEGGLVS